eukprot:2541351-Ditylum_brightwellii.AAC.1
MEYLHSDKDLIVKAFGQMKNPFSIISADDKTEKDKVPIADTPPVSDPQTETGLQGNPTTPANNQGNGDGRRDGMVTPTPNHHGPNILTSLSLCQTPYIEVLMEEDLQPTPPEEFSLGDETGDEEDDPPLSQDDTTSMEPHNLVEEDLGSHTPTNNNRSVSTTNQEGSSVNNITVTQMVGDLCQDARTPIDMVFDKDKNIHNEEVISMVMQDPNFILPATVVLYQKYREHIIAKQANDTAAAFLKNMQMRSTTMLTAEALVEEKN